MTQLYTVVSPNGDYVIGSGMSAVEAMHDVLTHDGHDYEIRLRDDGGYDLFVTQFSRNSTLGGRPMVKSVISSYEADEAAATLEIAQKVITADWNHSPDVYTDEQYAQMLRELAEDSE